jgi:hypothetical protein
MAMMCSMQGCKEKSGPCGHEKMMMLVALAAMAAAAFFAFKRFA